MKTSELIENLCKEVSAVKIQRPLGLFAKWAGFSVLYLFIMLMIFGLRDDIALKFQNVLFTAEIFSLLAVALTVGISSILLSYPDNYQKKYATYLPVIPLISLVIVLWQEAEESVSITTNNGGEFGCFICLCIFAFGPGIFLFRKLGDHATTSPRLASMMGLLASFCLGALTIRLSEKVDSMAHLIFIHYLPLIALSAIGLLGGRKWLKW
jgi:hypothetical protein